MILSHNIISLRDLRLSDDETGMNGEFLPYKEYSIQRFDKLTLWESKEEWKCYYLHPLTFRIKGWFN